MPKTKIDVLLEHDDTCPDQSDPYRAECDHDRLDVALRNLLIFDEDDRLPESDEDLLELVYEPNLEYLLPRLRELAAALDEIRNDEFRRDEFSYMRLAHSLCPMHGVDYAMCFEDDDPECSQIRAMFPGHDT